MVPKTLQAAIKYFADPKNVHEFMVHYRWPDGEVVCPKCGSKDVKFMEKYNRWFCREGHKPNQFTLKTGTIFEDSPIGLDKWFVAMWMLVNCKNGVSSWELHRTIGVTQKSAWFMLHRLRTILMPSDSSKMGGDGGEVEADETFIGGKAANMHKSRKARIQKLRSDVRNADSGGHFGKTAVMGILDRDARQIRAKVVPNVRREVLQDAILKNVSDGTRIYTDAAGGYRYLPVDKFVHEIVDHEREYVKGRVHTNGMENFWSLLKRGLKGTYVAVEPFHLDKYVDEQVYRYNNRTTKENPLTDGDRFVYALSQVVGKRLTYKELTGKESETTEAF